MIEKIRENPIKSAAGTIVLFVGMVVGVLEFDDRYAHASTAATKLELNRTDDAIIELASAQSGFEQRIQQNIYESVSGLRKRQIEDELFRLDFIRGDRPLSPLENATYLRLLRELDEIQSR